ncbi:RNA polymerase sigma factor [Tepidibacter formicigenes]|uniref:RNA polymerase, sigma-24 subunit, RpoE n=1 Tax=Tepidibacter formicigenes DSM 15518 TaxID=1123349 RepID=A0A1M6MX69_9FIRM|nr:sigma-70 family RNA polymerase sigma factor [Tepidibacter formicigenes]SHJ88026.1 RNA polymerase, sigma-24 subunit, RpoE [Tepidibacter formicigenes DSM 15518]
MDFNEKELIKKCINGDIDAFEELIKKHKQKAYNIALGMLKNPEDAMDVSQEAFIKVYKYIKNFNQKSSFSTWLYRIVMNTCLDFIKKNEKNKVYSINEAINNREKEIKDDYNNPEYVLDRKIQSEEIHKAIEQLSPVLKTAITLRDIQGFSYDEIANITNCSLGTVKSRIKRARDNLKKIIKESINMSYL